MIISRFTSCTYIIVFINVLSSVLVNIFMDDLIKKNKIILFFHRTYLKHNF